MPWFLALYTWGVVASGIVNTTKSLLALWYAKTEDEVYYNKFKEKSEGEKFAFFTKNILKMFIPVYNIIHPIKLLLDSNLPSLIHPIRALKDDGRRQLAIWKDEEYKRNAFKDKVKSKFKNVSNWFTKTKGKVNKEKEKMLEEKIMKNASKEESASKESDKKVETLQTKKAENAKKTVNSSSTRSSVSEQSSNAIKEIDSNLALLKKQYNTLKVQYDELKSKNASPAEINSVAKKMNKVSSDAKALIARRNTLKGKVVTSSKSTASVRTIDDEIEKLMNEQVLLERKYRKLSNEGASISELNELNRQREIITKKVRYLLSYKKNLANNEEKPSTGEGRTLRR